MTGRDRALYFLKGEKPDHVPFLPLVMQYAAQKTGVNYRDYCTDYHLQCQAMTEFARKFGMDYVHPAGWPYCEAIAYGLDVQFPDNALPVAKKPLISDDDFENDLQKVQILDIESSPTMMNRVEGIRCYKETVGDEFLIMGHCEGPFAEYADLRGVENAMIDLLENPEEALDAMRVITENAKSWIKLQIEAGADFFDIGDAVCSQIGERLYVSMVKPFHKELFSYIHSLGSYVKIHICGNITTLIPHLIEIDADIIDTDHMVELKPEYFDLLRPGQFFCGNIDPVQVIRFGTPELIRAKVEELKHIDHGRGKIALAGGCEIPLDTPVENYLALRDSAIDWT